MLAIDLVLATVRSLRLREAARYGQPAKHSPLRLSARHSAALSAATPACANILG
jgi:hypothetical protein